MAYSTAARAMDALGDPTRRAVFELLQGGEQSVGELAARLPVSRPAVSQHLRVLKEAELVDERKEGTRRLYHIDPRGLAEVRAYFDRFWNEALAAFKDAVEQPDEEEER
jgi:DNA-binding transcriptional ArsR family regulator